MLFSGDPAEVACCGLAVGFHKNNTAPQITSNAMPGLAGRFIALSPFFMWAAASLRLDPLPL